MTQISGVEEISERKLPVFTGEVSDLAVCWRKPLQGLT